MDNIPNFISIGFTCSHRFLVWILYNLFDRNSLWGDLEKKYPHTYNLDYEFPKIDRLTKTVKGEGPKRMTFDKRAINQSKYRILEEKFSYKSNKMSFSDIEISLSRTDRATKEKALIRYLKQVFNEN